MEIKKIIALVIILICCSCSSINLKSRHGKDNVLNNGNSSLLNGNYRNGNNDTSHRTLFDNFSDKSVAKPETLAVSLTSINSELLLMELKNDNTIVNSLQIVGKYESGYFKVKRVYKAEFIFNIILWMHYENLKYIGLTKENNIVLINSGGSGVLLFTILPIYITGGNQFDSEFERLNN